MRVLLTGIAGFLGSHTAAHILKSTDWQIVGLASFRHKGDPLRLEDDAITPGRVTMLYHDLGGPIGPRLIDRIGPVDAILNLASESHVDRSIADPLSVWENNTRLIGNILEYARVAKPKVFIQCSTDEVYGPVKAGEVHPEWDTMLPSNPYAASKAAQEMLAISYWRTYGVPLILTNTMNLFGQRQEPEKFVPMTIGRVLAGETVSIHSNGVPGSRCWLHARNYADAILWLLTKHGPPVGYGVLTDRPNRYNIVGQRFDNLEMAQKIAEHLGKPLRYELVDYHSNRPGHDLHYGLSGTWLKAFGWEPPVPFEASLAHTVDWTRDHPEWLR